MVIAGQRDLLIFIIRLFSIHHIDYLLTGSFAVSYYGVPRATHDIDFIVDITAGSLRKLHDAIKTLGKEYLSDADHIEESAKHNGLFTVYHLGTGIKIDFWILEEKDFILKRKRSQDVQIDHQLVHIISAEDLILNKLVWCKDVMSERHMRDCAGIWRIQGEKLDRAYLRQRAKELGVTALFNEISRLKIEHGVG